MSHLTDWRSLESVTQHPIYKVSNNYMTEASRFVLSVSFSPLMSVNIDFSFCKDSKEQSEICIHFIRFYTAILSVIF